MFSSLTIPMILSASIVFSCSKTSSGSRSSGSDGDDETNVDALEVNPLAEAYPEGLSMSVLAADSSSESSVSTGALSIDDSASLMGSFDSFELVTPNNLLGYDRPGCESYHNGLADGHKGKCSCSLKQARSQQPGGGGGPKNNNGPSEDDLKAVLFASGGASEDEAFKRLTGSSEVECFGPKLDKIFKGMMLATGGDSLYSVNCYEFDWGIEHAKRVDENENNLGDEVCLVAFTQSEVASAQAYLEFAKQFTQAMLCEAQKGAQSKELNDGDIIDLSTIVKEKSPDRMNVSSAKISKNGSVFYTDLAMSLSDPFSSKNLAFDMQIRHTPVDDNNYNGVIWLKHDLPPFEGNGSSTQFKALSVKYEGSRVTAEDPRRIKIELRMGHFKNGSEGIISDEGDVDFNAEASGDGNYPAGSNNQGERYAENMKHITYDGYPTEGVMNFSYWRNPGDSYNENSRGFIFNVHRQSDNTIKGCAFAGAVAAADVVGSGAFSIRKALAEDLSLEPKGFLRPFLCPYDPPQADPNQQPYTGANLARRYGPKIWKQCFVQNTDGTYSIDRSQTGGKDFLFNAASEFEFVPPPKKL